MSNTMLNSFPKWKYALIAMMVILGFVYSVPNLYGEDPAVQISFGDKLTLEPEDLKKVTNALAIAKIIPKSA